MIYFLVVFRVYCNIVLICISHLANYLNSPWQGLGSAKLTSFGRTCTTLHVKEDYSLANGRILIPTLKLRSDEDGHLWAASLALLDYLDRREVCLLCINVFNMPQTRGRARCALDPN